MTTYENAEMLASELGVNVTDLPRVILEYYNYGDMRGEITDTPGEVKITSDLVDQIIDEWNAVVSGEKKPNEINIPEGNVPDAFFKWLQRTFGTTAISLAPGVAQTLWEQFNAETRTGTQEESDETSTDDTSQDVVDPTTGEGVEPQPGNINTPPPSGPYRIPWPDFGIDADVQFPRLSWPNGHGGGDIEKLDEERLAACEVDILQWVRQHGWDVMPRELPPLCVEVYRSMRADATGPSAQNVPSRKRSGKPVKAQANRRRRK
jgi:hypothetical protein